ncbi:hypothetical protein [Leucobacter chromiireducens]|uniref:Uncharacterized protein n=1 Tax=Leucobacter chromiireducens subsp. chromiireducens TaxID=660067 RepID=A0ABS1SQ27_9MICO|nr:hypothetical protein [Leucobacter chromiireducens]MBL3690254.1 hypothetical protein [Leucobacter chromiireducens subsp. chromiireducens]
MEQPAARDSIMNRYGSLDEALVHRKASVPNRVFLRRLLSRMPIDRLMRTEGGILVERSDGAPAVQIFRGYTVGFQSEEEIIAVVGEAAPRWRSVRTPGAWAVDHPDHGRGVAAETESMEPLGGAKKARSGSRRTAAAKPKAEPKAKPAAAPERVQPVCPNCFMLMALSGVCGNCA